MGLKLKSTNGTGSVELNAPDNHNINTSFTLPTSNFTGGEWVLADGNGNVNIDSGTLYVDAVNDRVGIGHTTPTYELHVHDSGTGTVDSRIHLTNGDTGTSGGDGFHIIANGSTANYAVNLLNRENGPLALWTNNAQRLTVDSSGRVGIGTNSPVRSLVVANPTGTPWVSILNSAGDDGGILFGTSANDAIAQIRYQTSDNMLLFKSNGAERMRINSGGYLKASNTGTYNYTGGAYHELRNSANNVAVVIANTNTSLNNTVSQFRSYRGNNSAFSLIKTYSNNASDLEHHLRGDGNAYADGSWNGGGADYAEYFEWSDGNTAAEDRRGISVVLDGDKIRAAVDGEEPIGVISGNPSVVGDADMERWKEKYLRDDFGTYIREDCEVEDEDGNTVVQQCRVLNPDYDPDQEYVSREDRPEWDTVGLMGKLRIRKGQVTGSRWIKMRDISDTVEEWLVR